MKIIKEIGIENFEAWSGAVDTLNKIKTEGKCGDLEFLIEDIYPNGLTETELNDLLWFEDEWLFEQLGINIEE